MSNSRDCRLESCLVVGTGQKTTTNKPKFEPFFFFLFCSVPFFVFFVLPFAYDECVNEPDRVLAFYRGLLLISSKAATVGNRANFRCTACACFSAFASLSRRSNDDACARAISVSSPNPGLSKAVSQACKTHEKRTAM